MPKYQRIALFLDYENFHSTLQKRTSGLLNPYGFSPHMDFQQLVDFLCENYGALSRDDFIAVANFTHYDPQKGGLNRVATLIDVDSFEPRSVRNRQQSSAGKRYVIKNFADARLAYEIGKHVHTRPADLYIIASGDKIFAAIGSALQQAGIPVHFLIPYEEASAIVLRERFSCIDFRRTQKPETQLRASAPTSPPPPETTTDPVEILCETLSALRRALNTAIPVDLLKAFTPPGEGTSLLQKAVSQGRIDLWAAPESDVPCVSLQTERMYGKVTPIPVRPAVAERAAQLYALTRIPHYSLQEPTRAAWKHAIKDRLGLTSKETKKLLTLLFELQLLQPGNLQHPHLTLERVLAFIQRP
ncbi:MAG: hypothetical protein Fur0018_22850 [Anaerolineales bacterium]